jgi:hypothetical protein
MAKLHKLAILGLAIALGLSASASAQMMINGAGAVVISYNLDGNPALKLDGETIADIFLGKIKKCDYTAFFYIGRLIEFGPTTKIFTNPSERQMEDYITGRFG